jgi:hypothetical protein
MGPALGRACTQALRDLHDGAALAPKLAGLADGVNPSVLLDDTVEVEASLRGVMGALHPDQAKAGGRAAADSAVATVASGLAGLAQAAQGMRSGSRGLAAGGLSKVEAAYQQMKGLEAALSGNDAEEPLAPDPSSFGPSLGLDFSWWTSPANRSLNLSLNGSVPLIRTWDLGAAIRAGNSSVIASNASTNNNYSGFEAFTRVHFPTGRLAPYVGLHGGPTYNSAAANQWTVGPQCGLLFFMNERSAVDLQLRYDRVSSSDPSIAPQDQVWLTIGARLMFTGHSKAAAKEPKKKKLKQADDDF